MSDKEERILITKVSPHCRALRWLFLQLPGATTH